MDEIRIPAIPEITSSMAGSGLDRRLGMVCASDDFDEYRAAILNAYYPARLELVEAGSRLSDARMTAFRLTNLTVGIVRFGAEVFIDPGDVGGYHIDLPISGSVSTSCGGRRIIATPRCAAVYSPGEHTFVSSVAANATQVSIKIDKAALEGELAAMLARPIDRRVRFDIGFDMTTPAARNWWSTVQILLDTLTRPGQIPDVALAAQVGHLERTVIAGLLATQQNSMSESLRRCPVATHPSALRKAVDLVADAPGRQYTITDLAKTSGVGVRQLQKLFHDNLDMSPAEYVRNVRLDGARRDLLSAETTQTVTDVAFRWGFNHLGRFAQHYERKFGETPSQTLRRS